MHAKLAVTPHESATTVGFWAKLPQDGSKCDEVFLWSSVSSVVMILAFRFSHRTGG